jgi:uroporphyrinogen decarboxylase
LNDLYFSTLKGKLDIWFFGNDFGSQNGMMMSPPMWRDFFLENIRRLCALARSYGLRTMMHSCGSIRPIIGDLIGAGVELLDPLQTTARDMDASGLCAEFSDRIVFHGGLDTQAVLPLGSPETVRDESLRLLSVFADRPYVFASSQILGPDIPVENMHAMYQAAASVRGRIK